VAEEEMSLPLSTHPALAVAVAPLALTFAAAFTLTVGTAKAGLPEPPDRVEALYGAYLAKPEGQTVVAYLAERCTTIGQGVCMNRLLMLRKSRTLHPLVRQSVTYELAQVRRQAGDLEDARRLVSDLGFLTTWIAVGTPAGDVEVRADPVSGLVSAADCFEALPGAAQSFRSTLDSAKNSSVSLRLSAPHLEQVCVNDECSDVERHTRPMFDAVVVPVELKPGANSIVLVFSPEATAVRFAARLTDRDPERTSTAGHGEAPGGLKKPLDVLLACHAARLSGRMEEVDFEDSLSGVDQEIGKSLELLLEAHRCLRGHKGARKYLDAALTLEPMDPAVLVASAQYRMDVDQPFQAQRELLRLCSRTAPPAAPVDSAESSAPKDSTVGPPAAPMESAESSAPRDSSVDAVGCLSWTSTPRMDRHDYWTGAMLQSDLLRRASLPVANERFLRRLPFQCRGQDRGAVRALAELYIDADRFGEASDCLAQYASSWPGDRELSATLVYALEKTARLDGAENAARKLSALFPEDPYLVLSIAQMTERRGNTKEATDLHAEVISRWGANPYLLGQCAEYSFRSNDEAGALDLWRRALHLRPHDESLRKLIATRSTPDAAPDEVVPDRDAIRKLADSVTVRKSIPYVVVAERTRIMLRPNGTSVTTRFQAVRADAPDASRPYFASFQYDSSLDDVTVLRSEILRADGTVSPAADTNDTGVSGEEFNLFYDQRRVSIRYERLKPGDVVVSAWQVRSTPSVLSEPFSGIVWLQDDIPKHNVAVEIEVPDGVELHHAISWGQKSFPVEESDTRHDGFVRTRFDFPQAPPVVDEVFPIGPFESVASLHYSTMERWEDFARWYARLAYALMSTDARMEDMVELAFASGGSRKGTIETIARFVADEVRYVGLELGVHGLKPYVPSDVYRRGFGDCKDKSLLMVTLLAEAGIEAKMVTVSTFPRGRPSLSPISQALFDHAIVYLPEEDLYFDPTARWVGLGALPWQDQGAKALVIDEEAPRSVTLPESSAKDNELSVALDVASCGDSANTRSDEDTGDCMLVAGVLTFSGQFAWSTLQALENKGSWKDTVEAFVASVLPQVKVEDTQEELAVGKVPVLTVKLHGRLVPGGNPRLSLLDSARDSSRAVQTAKRIGPLVYAFPYRHTYRLSLDSSLLSLEGAREASGKENAANWRVKPGIDGDRLLLTVEFEQTKRAVEPDEYPSYRDVVLGYIQALQGLEVGIVH